MDEAKRLTLEEISRKINVSRTTIYKVISGKGFVKDFTRQAVLKALEKYNYKQNRNARNLALNRDYLVAYVGMKALYADYFSEIIFNGLNIAQRELEDHGLKLIMVETRADAPSKQIEQIRKLFNSGVKSFIIVPCDDILIINTIKNLKKNGCYVSILSRDVTEEKYYDCYVGVDYFKSGLLAAEIIGKMLGKGNIQFFLNQDSKLSIKSNYLRHKGFVQGIGNFSEISILPEIYLPNERGKAKQEVFDILRKNHIDGIVDFTYYLLETSEAMVEAGCEKSIRLVGFDLYASIEKYILSSVIDAIIFQDLRGQAYTAVKLLFDLMCYEKKIMKKKHYSRLDIIMSTNLDCYQEEYMGNYWQ